MKSAPSRRRAGQNLSGLQIAVVIVHAPSNDVSVLRPLMPAVREALAEAIPGKITHVRG